jgi:hypothetical protein
MREADFRLTPSWQPVHPPQTGYSVPAGRSCHREIPGMGWANRYSAAFRFMRSQFRHRRSVIHAGLLDIVPVSDWGQLVQNARTARGAVASPLFEDPATARDSFPTAISGNGTIRLDGRTANYCNRPGRVFGCSTIRSSSSTSRHRGTRGMKEMASGKSCPLGLVGPCCPCAAWAWWDTRCLPSRMLGIRPRKPGFETLGHSCRDKGRGPGPSPQPGLILK